MGTVVTLTSDAPVRVTVQTVKEEGRERVPNGIYELEADEEGSFVVSPKQSFLVEELPEPEPEPEPEEDEPEAEPDDE